MKQTYKKRLSQGKEPNKPALILLALAFLFGGIFAVILAASVSGSASESLSAYIRDFLAALRDHTIQKPSLISTIWSIFRWPILVVLFSYTSIGLVGIPAIFFLRGFLFSFCISAFVQVLGRKGLLFAMLLLGVESLLTIPILFLLGTQGISMAAQAKGRGPMLKPNRQSTNSPAVLITYTISLGVLLACTLWELIFLPWLLSGAAQALPLS